MAELWRILIRDVLPAMPDNARRTFDNYIGNSEVLLTDTVLTHIMDRHRRELRDSFHWNSREVVARGIEAALCNPDGDAFCEVEEVNESIVLTIDPQVNVNLLRVAFNANGDVVTAYATRRRA